MSQDSLTLLQLRPALGGGLHTPLFLFLLTSLPSCSPSHTESQTRPASPPSGCISDRPSPRLRGNRGRTGATHPSSGGTSSAAHSYSVSEGKKHAQNSHSEAARVSSDLHRCKSLTFSIRPLAPALKLPVKRHTLKALPANGHMAPSKMN